MRTWRRRSCKATQIGYAARFWDSSLASPEPRILDIRTLINRLHKDFYGVALQTEHILTKLPHLALLGSLVGNNHTFPSKKSGGEIPGALMSMIVNLSADRG